LAILLDRLVAICAPQPWAGWGLWFVAVLAVLSLWLVQVPSRMQASVLLDERLGLRERCSTTLALAESTDPFARVARSEALRVAGNARLRGHFPIRLTRSWYYSAGIWTVAALRGLCMPQRDLLGVRAQRQEREQANRVREEARAEVAETTEVVKTVVERLDDPNLTAELAKLDELARDGAPEDIKREAIKKLGDLSEKLRDMQANSQLQATAALEQMLKQLRGSPNPFSQELRMALGQGDFAKAAETLRALQKELADDSLSEEQRQAVAEQLQQLAKELQKIGDEQRKIEKELERLGLDPKLAEAGLEQLRQALQKQGMQAAQIEQLVDKMEAQRAAAARCAGLGQGLAGLGGGGGFPGGGLADAIDQLDALDALQQQAILLRVSLAEIGQCAGGLGAGLAGDHWKMGEGGGQGKGIGLSSGPHAITSDPLTADAQTRARTRTEGQDPVVASWYFKDAPVRGEATRSFAEVVQASRERAAEAIMDNQIPPRYEEPVKSYFRRLEETGRNR
jgi:hypothetical protein